MGSGTTDPGIEGVPCQRQQLQQAHHQCQELADHKEAAASLALPQCGGRAKLLLLWGGGGWACWPGGGRVPKWCGAGVDTHPIVGLWGGISSAATAAALGGVEGPVEEVEKKGLQGGVGLGVAIGTPK